MKLQPAIFEAHEIRRVYDEAAEAWLFSVIDIIQVLTQQPDYQGARKYWKVLKSRLDKEGSQLVTSCYQLKMTAEDGKQRLTDVATAETLLRLVQSVPSPKAEPIKLWLSKVGYGQGKTSQEQEIAIAQWREPRADGGRLPQGGRRQQLTFFCRQFAGSRGERAFSRLFYPLDARRGKHVGAQGTLVVLRITQVWVLLDQCFRCHGRTIYGKQ